MARQETSLQIILWAFTILTFLFTPTETWSGNVCTRAKAGSRQYRTCTGGFLFRSTRCQTRTVTYYYTEYYCCDGWNESIDGNEICTKRVPLLQNTVESYQEVPSLAWRSVSSDEEVIDDRTLPDGVYTAGEFFDIVTTEVDAKSITCGAKRKIWMNDTLPDADGSYHNKSMCVSDADTNNPCKDTFTIEVHNGGSFRVYALEAINSSKYGLENDTVSYCFDLVTSRDPCSATIPTSLPGLESHRPGNTEILQSDEHLPDNWYRVEPYRVVTNSPDFDSPNRCGAKYQIWMNDSFPEVDGDHHLRKLCVTDPVTSDTCVNSVHYTFIKNCGGSFRYFLTSSPKPESAYCFDIPSSSDDPAPDYTPSNVNIDVSLSWIAVGLTSTSLKPSLNFQCSFDKDDTNDFFYVVYFYVDGTYVNTGSEIIVQDPNQAYVTEQTLFHLYGFSAGITISCHVGTRSSRNGRTGVTIESPGFYAGIKMVYNSIDVQRGEKEVVIFYPTVPFGCGDRQTTPGSDCYLTLSISQNATHNTCGSNAIQHKCTVQMKGLTKQGHTAGIPWAINSTFEVITAESKRGSYNLANRHFTLRLSTGITHHVFWQNYQSEPVTVNVNEEETSNQWQGKMCQVYCDPHHLSFDGMAFDLHYSGKFLLFKSTDPPMQVQVEIQPCYNGGTPYCACGIVAIAGHDIYQIYTCFGNHIIQFMACNDNVLKADMVSSREYAIYLPTGAKIRVRIRGRRLLDIDITPTQHEYRGQVTGLCGNFDGDKCNDCVSKGGQLPCTEPAPYGCRGAYSYHPNTFTNSFRLTDEESFLNVQKPDLSLLEPYPSSRQVCVCPETSTNLDRTESGGSSSSTTYCTFKQYASCEGDQDKEMKCRQHLLLSNTRGKRSVHQKYTYEHERKERSVVMTESEATAACNLALMASPTYTTCVNLDISSSEIETCIADLMMTGDSTWTRLAVDRFQTACLEVITKNSTLQEQFPDEVNAIINYTCPNSCSEQGSCTNGVCSCDEGFASDDCSFNLTSPLNVSGLENDDLCDLRYGCDVILVNGPEFPNGRNYTCQYTGQMTFVNSSVRVLDIKNVTAQYQSLFGLLCDLPDVETLPGRLGIEYDVSVALDPYDFSTALSFVVIDSRCQTFTYNAGTVSYNVTDGYCFINGNCIPTGTDNNDDLCQECNSQENVYTWSQSKDCTVNDLNTGTGGDSDHVTVIVAVTCSVSVAFILVGLGVFYCKQQSNNISKERGNSTTAVYTARADVVGNLHFEKHPDLDKPRRLPPLEGKRRKVFHKDNKTMPFPPMDII